MIKNYTDGEREGGWCYGKHSHSIVFTSCNRNSHSIVFTSCNMFGHSTEHFALKKTRLSDSGNPFMYLGDATSLIIISMMVRNQLQTVSLLISLHSEFSMTENEFSVCQFVVDWVISPNIICFTDSKNHFKFSLILSVVESFFIFIFYYCRTF